MRKRLNSHLPAAVLGFVAALGIFSASATENSGLQIPTLFSQSDFAKVNWAPGQPLPPLIQSAWSWIPNYNAEAGLFGISPPVWTDVASEPWPTFEVPKATSVSRQDRPEVTSVISKKVWTDADLQRERLLSGVLK